MASIWQEIEKCESYLVCCMFEEAASLSSSILRQLSGENSHRSFDYGDELENMLESAGMVFVQSLKELGRTSDIVKEFELLFGSVAAVPAQVFITGICFQIQEGPFDVQKSLEEFLGNWSYVDGKTYVVASSKSTSGNREVFGSSSILSLDKYLEMVELYAVTLLGVIKKDLDLAISWVDKASLPDGKRQELLRLLDSLNSSKVTSSSNFPVSQLLGDKRKTSSSFPVEENLSNGSQNHSEARFTSNADMSKQAIIKLSGRGVSCFWWFRTITLKFGKRRFVISNGNVLLGCAIIFTYFLMRRKQVSLRRTISKRALSLKKALIDLWQLAFSYQVNPLAAVQPLPAARGSR